MTARGLVPDEYGTDHVVVVPRASDDVAVRAAAWFDAVEWVREPQAAAARLAPVGARFRGAGQSTTQAVPGVLSLGAASVEGPFSVTPDQASALGLAGEDCVGYALRVPADRGARSVVDDPDGLGRAFPQGIPVRGELRLLRWAIAVARGLRGVVLTSTGELLRPDPISVVSLTVYSPHPLSTAEMVPLLRKVVPNARVVGEQVSPDGVPWAHLTGESAYDGGIRLELLRVGHVPRALSAVPWREHGPYAYRMEWLPVEAEELSAEFPAATHVIARSRMRSAVARLAESVVRRAGGVAVDGDGFVVDARALRARGVDVPSGRMWL